MEHKLENKNDENSNVMIQLIGAIEKVKDDSGLQVKDLKIVVKTHDTVFKMNTSVKHCRCIRYWVISKISDLNEWLCKIKAELVQKPSGRPV